MNTQSVLVVGGAGFIGRHTVGRLAQSGYAVYATHHPDRCVDFVAPGVTWLATDLQDADATSGWPCRCDTLLFLAQARSWHDFPNIERDVFGVNVAGLMKAAWYAHRAGVKRFIYASTGSVYTQTKQPSSEVEPIDLSSGRNFYTACKLAGELLLSPYRTMFSVQTLRFYFPYGPYQNAKMLLPRLVTSVRNGSPVRLHGNDGFTCNPVAIGDVTDVILRCLSLDLSCTMNVAGPETVSLRRIVEAIGAAVGRKPVFEVQDDAVAPVIVGDTTLICETLGWAPGITFEEGLRLWLTEEESLAA